MVTRAYRAIAQSPPCVITPTRCPARLAGTVKPLSCAGAYPRASWSG